MNPVRLLFSNSPNRNAFTLLIFVLTIIPFFVSFFNLYSKEGPCRSGKLMISVYSHQDNSNILMDSKTESSRKIESLINDLGIWLILSAENPRSWNQIKQKIALLVKNTNQIL